jgi:hypothetical protein
MAKHLLCGWAREERRRGPLGEHFAQLQLPLRFRPARPTHEHHLEYQQGDQERPIYKADYCLRRAQCQIDEQRKKHDQHCHAIPPKNAIAWYLT